MVSISQRASDHGAEWAVRRKYSSRRGLLGSSQVLFFNGKCMKIVLHYIRPWVDLYKVDLKSFDDQPSHELGWTDLADSRDDPGVCTRLAFGWKFVTLADPRASTTGKTN